MKGVPESVDPLPPMIVVVDAPDQLPECAAKIDQRTLVLFRAVREAGRRLAERMVMDLPVLATGSS